MRLADNDPPILRTLLSGATGQFAAGFLDLSAQQISEATGLHRNTVQRRIQALQSGGVVEGYLFEPHPRAIGLVRAGHRFDGIRIADAETMADRLAPFPWISVASLHMESCFLHTWHETGAGVDQDVQAAAAALGASQVVPSFRSDLWPPMSADDWEPTTLDRRIMVALRRGPKRSAAAIADEVGANRRTVARHLDHMANVHAGTMIPVFRPGRIKGHLIVIFDGPTVPASSMEELARACPDRVMGPAVTGQRVMMMVPMTGLDEAARRRDELLAIVGVDTLDMAFMRDGLFPEACDTWLAQRVQNAPLSADND